MWALIKKKVIWHCVQQPEASDALGPTQRSYSNFLLRMSRCNEHWRSYRTRCFIYLLHAAGPFKGPSRRGITARCTTWKHTSATVLQQYISVVFKHFSWENRFLVRAQTLRGVAFCGLFCLTAITAWALTFSFRKQIKTIFPNGIAGGNHGKMNSLATVKCSMPVAGCWVILLQLYQL